MSELTENEKAVMEFVTKTMRETLERKFVGQKNDPEKVKAAFKKILEKNQAMLEFINSVLATEPPEGKTQLDVFLENLNASKGKDHENS